MLKLEIGNRHTAAPTTGPANGPRPASSQPIVMAVSFTLRRRRTPCRLIWAIAASRVFYSRLRYALPILLLLLLVLFVAKVDYTLRIERPET